MSTQDFLKTHGTYKKSNGTWVAPVVNWVWDRFNGAHHPVIIEIRLKWWSDNYMNQYKLKSYPNPQIRYSKNITVNLPKSSNIKKPWNANYTPNITSTPIIPSSQETTKVTEVEKTVVTQPLPIIEESSQEVKQKEEPRVLPEKVVITEKQGPKQAVTTKDDSAQSKDSENSMPLPSDDVFEFNLQDGVTQVVWNVLENDTDLDGDTLSVISLTNKKLPISSIRRNASDGWRVLINRQGDISFKAISDFYNIEAWEKIRTSIEYEVQDSSWNRAQATVYIEVMNGSNSKNSTSQAPKQIVEEQQWEEIISEAPPVANNDSFTVFSDVKKVPSFRNATSGGRMVIAEDGRIFFRPGRSFWNMKVGQTVKTEMIYQIHDGKGWYDQATVTIFVKKR